MEKESNFIMEHVFHALNDELWAKREQIFKDFESDDYIDAKTLRLVKDKKDYKPRSVVKNDLKHTRELTEMKLDMTANQCLVTRVGEKHPRHTLKSIGEWTFNRRRQTRHILQWQSVSNPSLFILFIMTKSRPLIAINENRGSGGTILDDCRDNDF